MDGACITNWEENECIQDFVEKARRKDPLVRPDVGVWILLKCISERWDGLARTGLIWLRIGTCGGLLLQCNEISGSIKF
jgi:hypothetical protein